MVWIYTKAPILDGYEVFRYHHNSYNRILKNNYNNTTYYVLSNNRWIRFKDDLGFLPLETRITEEELDIILIQKELEK